MEKEKEIPIGSRYKYKVNIENKESGIPNSIEITVNDEEEAKEIIRSFWNMFAQTSLEEDQKRANFKLSLQNPFKDLPDAEILTQLTMGGTRTMVEKLYDRDNGYKEKKELLVRIKNNGGKNLPAVSVEALKRLGFNLNP